MLEKSACITLQYMKHPFLDNTITVNWSTLTPDHVETDISYAIKETQKKIDSIAALDLQELTYDNTLAALEEATENLQNAWGKVGHLDSVCNSKELREAYNKMLPEVSGFFTKVFLNEKLWTVTKSFAESKEGKSLTGIKKRHMDEVIKDFRESGSDLEKDKKLRLETLNAELAQLTQKFSENVLDATNAWELIITDESQLSGLPKTAKEGARLDALRKDLGSDENPQWRFTLHAPSIMPVMQYLESDKLRKEFWEASSNIGRSAPYDNSELIANILKLRQEKAELLGKNNFADLTLERRMAKNGEVALNFVNELHEKIEKFFNEELEILKEYKAKTTGQKKQNFEPWEISYWAEKRRKAEFDFDEEELRPYFPINSVIKGMFELVQKIFSIELKERPTEYIEPGSGKTPSANHVEVWHPDVKYYDVHDAQEKHLGSFYADWYPRETKRGGAWMNHLHTGNPGEPHLGLICGNLTPPQNDKPALLTHNEVETIFHEFGHLLHHILSEVEVKSLHGTNVAWDFVELPSQIMENWCWERESLNLFARHFESGNVIPEELFQKMLATRNYLSAMATMRQLSIAKMDLELHIHAKSYQGKDLEYCAKELLKGYLPEYKTPAPTLLNRLTHVFADPTGYAAGYYSYKWAEVLDADAFTRFLKEGVMNPEVGKEFRDHILAQGNAKPADELFHHFMGRGPDLQALLERSGLCIKS